MKKIFSFLLPALLLLATVQITTSTVTAQGGACPDLANTYGHLRATVDVETAGNYTVWARMKSGATAQNKELSVSVGNQCGVLIGGNPVAADGQWYWTSVTTTNTAIVTTLATGSQVLQIAGTANSAGVGLDRVLLLSNTCVPTGFGDNCADAGDENDPVVTVSTPVSGSEVSGNSVSVIASVQDQSPITQVRLIVDGTQVQTTATAPYNFTWDSTTVTDGAHSIRVDAVDEAGNVGASAAVPISVRNAQLSCAGTTSDTCEDFSSGLTNFTPAGGNWSATSGFLTLTGPASIGAAGNANTAIHSQSYTGDFTIDVTGRAIDSGQAGDGFSVIFNYQNANNYQYAHISEAASDPNGSGVFTVVNGTANRVATFTDAINVSEPYNLRVERDGNTVTVRSGSTQLWTGQLFPTNGGAQVGVGTRSNAATFDNFTVSAEAGAAPSDNQAPSRPTGLTAVSTSTTTVNLNWTASTDNVGVVGYQITRIQQVSSEGSGQGQPQATFDVPASTSYVNTGLLAGTQYTYVLSAIDAAGNRSGLSDAINVSTQAETPTPPPTCGVGQTGTPPNCVTPTPETCAAGQTGTPPNCVTPTPTCPAGQVGTPPSCTTPPPNTSTPGDNTKIKATPTPATNKTPATNTTTKKAADQPVEKVTPSVVKDSSEVYAEPQYRIATMRITTKGGIKGYIEYGESSSLGKKTDVREFAKTDSVTISSLDIAKTYYYRVVEVKDSGEVPGDVQTFRTKGLTFVVTIFDKKGSPVKNRAVTMYSDPIESETDSDGVAVFEDVTPGEHEIVYLDDGVEVRQKVTVEDNITSSIQNINGVNTVVEESIDQEQSYVLSESSSSGSSRLLQIIGIIGAVLVLGIAIFFIMRANPQLRAGFSRGSSTDYNEYTSAPPVDNFNNTPSVNDPGQVINPNGSNNDENNLY